MLKKLAFATVSMVLLATIQPASAQDSFVLERIKERGTINMGHREASVPFAYLKVGSVLGYSIDLCDLFVEKI
ncbi:MAG: amino acid ABC transporter substrate-binding protein, partial [Gammaproteobacteria bacterium]|nr:amino acid ABC transporter substrate-binding protein [Gammaproteobacteria bacterium]